MKIFKVEEVLKIEAEKYSEVTIYVHQNTWRHSQEESNLYRELHFHVDQMTMSLNKWEINSGNNERSRSYFGCLSRYNIV
jgi:hypothetical protein